MRYKEFNRNRVLEKCIRLFWNHGFGATSISQIVEETGVNRFSLYAEFDNKEGILYAAIPLYLERIANPRLQMLTNAHPDAGSLEAFFMAFLRRNFDYPKGCFLIYIATELGKENEVVNQNLKSYLSTLNQAFRHWAAFQGITNNPVVTNQLVGLYCSAMCYGIILSEKEIEDHVRKNLNVILKDYIQPCPSK